MPRWWKKKFIFTWTGRRHLLGFSVPCSSLSLWHPQYLGGSWIHAVWISFKLQQAFNPKKQPNSFSFSISQHWCATVHNFFVQTSSSVAQIWAVYTFDSQTRWFDLTSVTNKVEAHLGPRLPSTMNNIFFLVRSKHRDKENIHDNYEQYFFPSQVQISG